MKKILLFSSLCGLSALLLLARSPGGAMVLTHGSRPCRQGQICKEGISGWMLPEILCSNMHREGFLFYSYIYNQYL
ncbi:MAG: hypothetical protein K2K25_02015 [Muribaculaceae bacterium]|nr:hypothetical protein [Muribaculaceae bacterium]